jgi:hypothetical protein
MSDHAESVIYQRIEANIENVARCLHTKLNLKLSLRPDEDAFLYLHKRSDVPMDTIITQHWHFLYDRICLASDRNEELMDALRRMRIKIANIPMIASISDDRSGTRDESMLVPVRVAKVESDIETLTSIAHRLTDRVEDMKAVDVAQLTSRERSFLEIYNDLERPIANILIEDKKIGALFSEGKDSGKRSLEELEALATKRRKKQEFVRVAGLHERGQPRGPHAKEIVAKPPVYVLCQRCMDIVFLPESSAKNFACNGTIISRQEAGPAMHMPCKKNTTMKAWLRNPAIPDGLRKDWTFKGKAKTLKHRSDWNAEALQLPPKPVTQRFGGGLYGPSWRGYGEPVHGYDLS